MSLWRSEATKIIWSRDQQEEIVDKSGHTHCCVSLMHVRYENGVVVVVLMPTA